MHLIIKKTSFGSSIEPSYSVVGTAKTYELATKLIEAHNLINESKSVEFHAVLKDEVKDNQLTLF